MKLYDVYNILYLHHGSFYHINIILYSVYFNINQIMATQNVLISRDENFKGYKYIF